MRLRLMVEVGKGKLLTLILGALVAGSAFADRAANREWVERNFTTHGAATNAAKAVVAAATGGLVPYTGATADVDLGYFSIKACNVWSIMGFSCGNAQTMVTSGTYFGDSFADGSWNYYYLPWSPNYGSDPTHDFAMRSDIQGAFVPYTGATADVDLGYYNLNACNVWARMGFCCGDPQTMVSSGSFFGDAFADGSYVYYYLPWSPNYGGDPTHDFAMRSDVAAIEVTSEKLIGLVQSMSDAQKAALKAALGIE